MQRIAEIICWAVVGIFFLYGILYVLTRTVGVGIGLFRLFAESLLPWWILAPAGLACLAGVAYLLRGVRFKTK